MTNPVVHGWRFCDERGTFELIDPQASNYLYFPLINERGLVSVITPTLHGDLKLDQNTFLTLPVSVEDLHTSRAARNFWVKVDGKEAWSVTGNSASQIARRFNDDEDVKLEAGFLWHTLTRMNATLGLRADVTNFVPPDADHVELMCVTLTNIGDDDLTLTPTAAIPIYGRSADNLRDHRHVTSLLQRTHTSKYGVSVKPTLSFDERGHQPNAITYAVLGADENGVAPIEFFPLAEDFSGEGGTLDWPEAIVRDVPGIKANCSIDGYESIGGLRFAPIVLAPDQSRAFIVIMAILDQAASPAELIERYGTAAKFDEWLTHTEQYWLKKLDTLHVATGDQRFDQWLKWVTLQPTLRRLAGNSWLPYHDYGRGGRGWRDLWQDILALLITETGNVSELLFSNFAGVRVDGSNATIIGSAPGEFKADRNNIPRVWMDHGAWPLLTTKLYIDQTGDLNFLLREQAYFKDRLIYRTQQRDDQWQADQGTQQCAANGATYRGTVLEHLLIQHLTPFFNVGEHNIIRLEGADWNDGLDMARTRGESVAFTAMYAGNLKQLSELALMLEKQGVSHIDLAAEMLPLLDTLYAPIDYTSIAGRHARLNEYFESVSHTLSGQKARLNVRELADDLNAKAEWLFNHLRAQEWITNHDGYAWFNGYYDNDGQRVEGDHPLGVRMTLTGQVFTLMSGVASDEQARTIARSADRYLYDPRVGGYRLNTDFGEVLLNLGRCFGFAFGHKENGAMFSHMAVMYANALYQRGLIDEGYKVLTGLYQHCQNFEVSRMYPGLPEYITPRGRGVYPYLTGAASWYLLTLVTEVFGMKGTLGDLSLSPRLVPAQFDVAGRASVSTLFAGQRLEVVYHNPGGLNFDQYDIATIELNGASIPFERDGDTAVIARSTIETLDAAQAHTLEVILKAKS
ncbi:MAG: cellobiose phosphorylase [Chloroflexi bacterium]|nr:cellobiose phosphorylase [Chloroflexota bacterium]